MQLLFLFCLFIQQWFCSFGIKLCFVKLNPTGFESFQRPRMFHFSITLMFNSAGCVISDVMEDLHGHCQIHCALWACALCAICSSHWKMGCSVYVLVHRVTEWSGWKGPQRSSRSIPAVMNRNHLLILQTCLNFYYSNAMLKLTLQFGKINRREIHC